MNAFARADQALARGLVVVFAAAALAMTAGCGAYSTRSRTARDIRTVAVPFFENATDEPDLEIAVTEGIVRSLIDDNTLKVVDEDRADAVLEGRIVRFENRAYSFDPDLNAQEYRVFIEISATLYNRRTSKPIFEKKRFSGSATYFVEPIEGQNTFEDAKKQVIDLITDRILSLTVQDW